jgi:hypothetical protein
MQLGAKSTRHTASAWCWLPNSFVRDKDLGEHGLVLLAHRPTSPRSLRRRSLRTTSPPFSPGSSCRRWGLKLTRCRLALLLGSSVRDADSCGGMPGWSTRGPVALVTDVDHVGQTVRSDGSCSTFSRRKHLVRAKRRVVQRNAQKAARPPRRPPSGVINLDLEAGRCSLGPGFSLVSPGEGNPARTRFRPPRVFPLATRHPSVQRVRPQPAIPSFAPWKHQSRSEDLPRHHER